MKKTILQVACVLLSATASFAATQLDTLKMDELRRSPITTIDQALLGRYPSLGAYLQDDAPLGTASFSGRVASAAPLFVVDGVVVNHDYVSSINPAQVESIVLLTDASQTSVYGMEALGGVVKIELKKGQYGKPIVDLDSFWGVNSLSKASLAGTNYIGEAFRSALLHQYNASVSGGNKVAGSKFFTNISYVDDGGVLKGTSANRFQASMRYEQNLSQRVAFYLAASYRTRHINGIDTSTPYADYCIFEGGSGVQPYDHVDSYIMYHVLGLGQNPVSTLENAFAQTIKANITGEVGLRYNIFKGLDLNVSAFYNAGTTDCQKFNNKRTLFGASDAPYGMYTNAVALANRDNRYNVQAALNYSARIQDHSVIKAAAGVRYTGADLGFRGQRSYKMTTDALGTAALNTGIYLPVPIFDASFSNLLAYGNVDYTLAGKYQVRASLAASSYTGFQTNPWNILPSIGASWNYAAEDFLEGSILSSGSLSASWGKVGSTVTNLNHGEVAFDQIVANQMDFSVSAGLFEDRLRTKLGAYFIQYTDLEDNRISLPGLELNVNAYAVKTQALQWSVFANAAYLMGPGQCWGGAGTVLQAAGFDFRTNLYWTPQIFSCVNLTAGYSIGQKVLKVCSARVFLGAGSLGHRALYKGMDLSKQNATLYPGRYNLTGGLSIQF